MLVVELTKLPAGPSGFNQRVRSDDDEHLTTDSSSKAKDEGWNFDDDATAEDTDESEFVSASSKRPQGIYGFGVGLTTPLAGDRSSTGSVKTVVQDDFVKRSSSGSRTPTTMYRMDDTESINGDPFSLERYLDPNHGKSGATSTEQAVKHEPDFPDGRESVVGALLPEPLRVSGSDKGKGKEKAVDDSTHFFHGPTNDDGWREPIGEMYETIEDAAAAHAGYPVRNTRYSGSSIRRAKRSSPGQGLVVANVGGETSGNIFGETITPSPSHLSQFENQGVISDPEDIDGPHIPMTSHLQKDGSITRPDSLILPPEQQPVLSKIPDVVHPQRIFSSRAAVETVAPRDGVQRQQRHQQEQSMEHYRWCSNAIHDRTAYNNTSSFAMAQTKSKETPTIPSGVDNSQSQRSRSGPSSRVTQDFAQFLQVSQPEADPVLIPFESPRPAPRPGQKSTPSAPKRRGFSDPYETTPSPPRSWLTPAMTPTSSIGNAFRRGLRSSSKSEARKAPLTPTTPITPTTHWAPFDPPTNEPPCSSSWLFGSQENRLERALREAHFEEQAATHGRVEQDLHGNIAAGHHPHVQTLRKSGHKSYGDLRPSTTANKHPMAAVPSTFDNGPKPYPRISSPIPAVPPLPQNIYSKPSSYSSSSYATTSTNTGGSSRSGASVPRTRKPEPEAFASIRARYQDIGPTKSNAFEFAGDTMKMFRKASRDALRSASSKWGRDGKGKGKGGAEPERDENGDVILKSVFEYD